MHVNFMSSSFLRAGASCAQYWQLFMVQQMPMVAVAHHTPACSSAAEYYDSFRSLHFCLLFSPDPARATHRSMIFSPSSAMRRHGHDRCLSTCTRLSQTLLGTTIHGDVRSWACCAVPSCDRNLTHESLRRCSDLSSQPYR